MKFITVDVDADGNATVEAVGFTGKGCEAATKAIEHALGTVKKSKPKPEIFQRETSTQPIGLK